RIDALLAQFLNLGARRVLPRLQFFGFSDRAAPLLVELTEIVEIERGSARRQAFCHLFEVGAEECQIQHSTMLSGEVGGPRPVRDLLFLFLHGHLFEVLCLEDLAAIQALHVIDPVAPGYDLSAVVFTSGLHKARLLLGFILSALYAVSRGLRLIFHVWPGYNS